MLNYYTYLGEAGWGEGVLATGSMKTSFMGEVGKGNVPPSLPLGLTPD